MKVLHFYKTYLPDTIGGTEQVINQIIRGTTKLGVTSEVLTLTDSTEEQLLEVDGHLVHRCQSNLNLASTPFSLSVFKKFKELAEKADLIHFHFPYPFADIVHFASKAKKPTLVSYNSDIVKQKYLLKLYKPLMNSFLSDVDHIVAASPNYKNSSETLAKFAAKTSVIPYGLDKTSYPTVSTEKSNYWKEQFGFRFFLFVGVIRYYKGLHSLVEASRNSEYPVLIVGGGPLEEELKKKALGYGLKNIHFLGFLPNEDKVALLQLCYAFVFPSHIRSEAFGISLLEAAMYGKPLISCEIGTGTTYINIHQETGLVASSDNPTSLFEAMDYLWKNPKEAKAMGKAAADRYWKIFTSEKMAKSYEELYRRLTNKA